MTTAFARKTDPTTSHLAAAAITPNITNLEKQVLHYLRLYGAMTSHELSAKSGISLWSLTPRLKPLEKKNMIERRGTKTSAIGRKRALTLWGAK